MKQHVHVYNIFITNNYALFSLVFHKNGSWSDKNDTF